MKINGTVNGSTKEIFILPPSALYSLSKWDFIVVDLSPSQGGWGRCGGWGVGGGVGVP